MDRTVFGHDITHCPDAPESTATKAQTTANGVSAGAVSASLTALPTVTPSPFSSKPSDVGAIAGGVVGGIVGLAALAALGIWFFKRGRRTISSPSPLMSQHDLSDGIDSAALKLYASHHIMAAVQELNTISRIRLIPAHSRPLRHHTQAFLFLL